MDNKWKKPVGRRRLLRTGVLGLTGIAGAALIGCGDEEEATPSAAGTSSSVGNGTAAPAATTADSTPSVGGPLRLRQASDPVHLDPHKTILYQTANYSGFTYSRLIRPAVGESIGRASFVVEADLAERWEVPDDLTYTFTLNPESRWHDLAPVDGRAVTAEDVAYTIERNLDPVTASDSTYIWSRLSSVEVVDDLTITLKTSSPYAPQFSYFMGNHSWIIPREVVEQEGDLTRKMIGSGPFILKSWEEGIGAEFERNPNWANGSEGAPFFSGVEYPLVADESAALARFLSGQFDVLGIRPEDRGQAESRGATVRQEPGTGDSHLTFGRLSTPPFNDPRVRRALGRLVDRDQIAELVYGGNARPKGPIAPGFTEWALPPEEVAELFGYNPDDAESLISAAGMSFDDITITIDVTPRYGTSYPQMAEIVAAAWQSRGVNVTISQNEYAAQIQKWQTADSDAILNPQTQFLEPDEFLSFYHSEGDRNWTKFSEPKIDEMIERQRTMINPEERNELVKDIQRELSKHMSTIPLVTPDVFTAIQPNVRNYYDNITYGYEGSSTAWFADA